MEFVSRLANSLGVELVKAESLRAIRERPGNPDAVDLAMQGWALINPVGSKEKFGRGRWRFERALTLDPQNARAMTGLASVLQWSVFHGWSDNPNRDMGRAAGLIKHALDLQPGNSMLRVADAQGLAWRHQWRAAIAEAETAIAYDRNNALAHAMTGYWKQYLGRSQEGVADLETALRLDPHGGGVPFWQNMLCRAHNLLGHWERAIEWCDRAIAADPELTNTLVDLAAANAWAGRVKEAREAVARLQTARPGLTMQKLDAEDQWTDDPTFKAQFARIIEGLRKAGLPDEPIGAAAHLIRANALNGNWGWGSALAEVEAVIADDPDNAKAYGAAALYNMYLGRSEEAIADAETALRLSPSDNEARTWLARLFYLHNKLAQWEQGIEWCENAIAASTPEKSYVLANLAAAHAWAGHNKEAYDAAARLRDQDRNFTLLTYQAQIETHDNPTYQAQSMRVLEGMRKAGVPEE